VEHGLLLHSIRRICQCGVDLNDARLALECHAPDELSPRHEQQIAQPRKLVAEERSSKRRGQEVAHARNPL
jgi:hypothetical protein